MPTAASPSPSWHRACSRSTVPPAPAAPAPAWEYQRDLGGDAEALDPSRAATVAAAAGARYLLRGATLKLGDQVFLKAEVIEVASGRVVSAQRIPDVSGENLTSKLGELAELLRADLAEIQ